MSFIFVVRSKVYFHNINIIKMFRPSLNIIALRALSQASKSGLKPSEPSSAASGINTNVPGLTENCVKPPSGKLGPGAAIDGQYKVPEYYSFNRFSYAEAEVEMAKYRLPQPSALKK